MKNSDLRGQLNRYSRTTQTDITRRLFFKKIQKGYNQKDVKLAEALHEIDRLKAENESLRPTKRRKVDLSPNTKFATIKEVRKAQMKADGETVETSESDGSDSPISEPDCIVVR